MTQLVKTNDRIQRKDKQHSVIIADDNLFVIAEITPNEDGGTHTDFEHLEAYSNDQSINTLESLEFQIIN